VRAVGAVQMLQHLSQGRAPGNRKARDGGFDGDRIVAGQQLVEERLGLTGTGRHERGDCNA
jgi:hypothetical protein